MRRAHNKNPEKRVGTPRGASYAELPLSLLGCARGYFMGSIWTGLC